MAESLHILLGTSACLQWLCHSGERTVARGPLVLFFFNEKKLIFPLFLHKNFYCGYNNIFFLWRSKKNIYPISPLI